MSHRIRHGLLIALAAELSATPSSAQERRLAYSLPNSDRVQRIADQVYRSLAGTRDTTMYGAALRYDVFLPPPSTDGKPRPGVVFIHGGLVPETTRVSPKDDIPSYRQWGTLVASAGLVGVTFSHRLNTNDNFEVADNDVAELLRTVRSRAAQWQLDPDRLCVAVFSAGGPLASLFLRPTPQLGVRCVALFYAFLDTEHTAVHSPFRMANKPERVAELERFSPRLAVFTHRQRLPPMLVLRGGRDAIPGINASIERFVQAALWVNAPLDLYVHPTGAHGFDMTTGPDPRASQIVEATLAFFQRHLR